MARRRLGSGEYEHRHLWEEVGGVFIHHVSARQASAELRAYLRSAPRVLPPASLVERLDQVVELFIVRNREYLPQAAPEHPDIGLRQQTDRDKRIIDHNKLPRRI
jgi:hypothetical protein